MTLFVVGFLGFWLGGLVGIIIGYIATMRHLEGDKTYDII